MSYHHSLDGITTMCLDAQSPVWISCADADVASGVDVYSLNSIGYES